jgi:hypothetical protein
VRNPTNARPSPPGCGHFHRREMSGAFATFIVTIAEVNMLNNCYF